MDVAILEDLASLLRDGAVHITRNHEELNPNSVPPEQRAIMVKCPIRGGFQPLGAKTSDGSPLPHVGTGFGMGRPGWSHDKPDPGGR